MRVTVYHGKYTVIQDPGGGLSALRYGEPWRDCTGDGLILALAQEVEELRETVARLAPAAADLCLSEASPSLPAAAPTCTATRDPASAA
jgi:hypothetical protein